MRSGREFLEAFEALKLAVAWEAHCEQAAVRSGSKALDKVRIKARDEIVEAAKRLVHAGK